MPEKVDVFVRVFAISDGSLRGDLRWGLTQATIARWLMQKDINLTLLCAGAIIRIAGAESVLLPEEKFHMESKREAEKRAHIPIYVIADDDCLPLGADFIRRGVRMLNQREDYGLVSATSICDGLYPSGKSCHVEDIEEAHSVGGIVFCRKGLLSEFNDLGADRVDESIYEETKRLGYKVGVLTRVRFNHLGCGFSLTGGAGNWLA